MALVKKLESKLKKIEVSPKESVVEPDRGQEEPQLRSHTSDRSAGTVLKSKTVKKCFFCKTKTEPVYWDSANLRKFLNDRGRIYPRQRTGSCAKHQRRIAKHIKYARHVALLPFTVHI